MRNSSRIFFDELDCRINYISAIQDKWVLLTELSRIVSWVKSRSEFAAPLEHLSLLREEEESRLMQSVTKLIDLIKATWNQLRPEISKPHISSYLDGQYALNYFKDIKKKKEANVVAEAEEMIKNSEMYSPNDLYSRLRFIVEQLGVSPDYRHIVGNIYDYETTKFINGLYELIIQNENEKNELQKKVGDSTWGALVMLKQLLLFPPNSSDLMKELEVPITHSEKRDRWIARIHRVRDFIFDFIETPKIFTKVSLENVLRGAIWDDSFCVRIDKLDLGRYGSIGFFPNRDPGTGHGNKVTDGMKLIKLLLEHGRNGVERDNIAKLIPTIGKTGVSGQINHLNDRFKKAFEDMQVNALVKLIPVGMRGRQIVFLKITPRATTFTTERAEKTTKKLNYQVI